MVPGTLAHSMNRGGMRCGLRLRVLELAEGTHRLPISITNWEGWSPWLLVFLQQLAAEQEPAWRWQRRNKTRVVA